MNDQVIEVLEMLLEEAKQGRIDALAYTTFGQRAKEVGSGWCGEFAHDVFYGLGAIDHLKSRFYFQSVTQD